jgi:hypothetical protein
MPQTLRQWSQPCGAGRNRDAATPNELSAHFKLEIEKWEQFIKHAKLKPE